MLRPPSHHPFHCWAMLRPPSIYPFHCWAMLRPPSVYPFHCWARRDPQDGDTYLPTMVPGYPPRVYMPFSRVIYVCLKPGYEPCGPSGAHGGLHVHRVVDGITLLVRRWKRGGLCAEERRLFLLRINRPSGQKQADKGQETRYRKGSCTRTARKGQPLRNCSQTPLKERSRLFTPVLSPINPRCFLGSFAHS